MVSEDSSWRDLEAGTVLPGFVLSCFEIDTVLNQVWFNLIQYRNLALHPKMNWKSQKFVADATNVFLNIRNLCFTWNGTEFKPKKQKPWKGNRVWIVKISIRNTKFCVNNFFHFLTVPSDISILGCSEIPVLEQISSQIWIILSYCLKICLTIFLRYGN